MREYLRPVTLTFIVVLVSVGFANAQSASLPPDPMVGAWTLNLAKSKYVTPAPKRMTITITPAARGYTMIVDAVAADGQPQNWRFTSAFDGSESEISGNSQIDSVVASSTGNGASMRYKKAGNVITTTSSVTSDDGRTLVVTMKIPDGKGNEFTNTAVYEKQ